MLHLKYYFDKHPIIASIRNENQLKKAIKSDVIVIVIMGGSILDFEKFTAQIKANDKLILLHIDLIKGIARDKDAVKFLALHELCDGIISTNGSLVKTAMNEGIIGVQRLFLLDSDAVNTGKKMLINNAPDAMEILPGMAAPYFINQLDKLDEDQLCPILAGGLIRTKDEIHELKAKGVFAVTTGKEELWFK